MKTTWLHVSDFHIRGGDSYDRDVVFRALVKSVKNFRSRGVAPDLIFATGDIAYSGKAQQYELATRFFDELLEAAALDRNRLFVIPGNHDVDRDLGVGLSRTLESREQADQYFGPTVPKTHLTQKQGAFLDWHNRYFKGIRVMPVDTTCAPIEVVNIRGQMIAILAVNSALFCQDDHDHAKLWIGRRCLDAAVESLQAHRTHINIALMHHPVAWLHSREIANIRAALQSNFDLVLRGHLHENDVESIVSASGEALYCAAGAAYQTRKWPNRAVYASIDGDSVTILPIRYEDEPEAWTVDPSLFPNEPEYQRSFQIPRRKPKPPGTPELRVLDAAIPACIPLGQASRLLAQIRRSESGGLRAVLSAESEWDADPEDVRSSPITLEFPTGLTGERDPLILTLRVESPDFEPPKQSKDMIIPVEGDGDVCTFLLTPKQVGHLWIKLELESEHSFRGGRTLRTNCAAGCGTAGGRMTLTTTILSFSWTGGTAWRTEATSTSKFHSVVGHEPEGRSAAIDKSPVVTSRPDRPGPGRLLPLLLQPKVATLIAISLGLVAIMVWRSHGLWEASPAPQQLQLGYVWVRPGEYRMGCSFDDSACYRDEIPQHVVKLAHGFSLKQTEVTIGDFRAYTRATGAPMPTSDLNAQLPMASVTWDEAKAYCEWTGGRLPTEAEWEYAVRAGKEERFYGRLDVVAWYQGNTDSSREVGQKQRNGFSLYDMLGNVSEWVNDRYDEKYFQSSPSDDPKGPSGGEERVVRGGSYLDGPNSLRVSRREARSATAKGAHIGFRCAVDPKPSRR